MNKYLAELLGTFALTLAVGVSLAGKFPVPTPLVAALALGICVYTMSAISGTHINPAITLQEPPTVSAFSALKCWERSGWPSELLRSSMGKRLARHLA